MKAMQGGTRDGGGDGFPPLSPSGKRKWVFMLYKKTRGKVQSVTRIFNPFPSRRSRVEMEPEDGGETGPIALTMPPGRLFSHLVNPGTRTTVFYGSGRGRPIFAVKPGDTILYDEDAACDAGGFTDARFCVWFIPGLVVSLLLLWWLHPLAASLNAFKPPVLFHVLVGGALLLSFCMLAMFVGDRRKVRRRHMVYFPVITVAGGMLGALGVALLDHFSGGILLEGFGMFRHADVGGLFIAALVAMPLQAVMLVYLLRRQRFLANLERALATEEGFRAPEAAKGKRTGFSL